jgi:hypothetical protein
VLPPRKAESRPSQSRRNQLKHKFVGILSALAAKVNRQRSVEISLFGKKGCQTAGNVTIPANQSIPRAGEVIEVRYLFAHSQSDIRISLWSSTKGMR